MPAYEQMLQVIETGNLQLLQQQLSQFLLEASLEEQYALYEQLAQLGFLQEADEVLQHLQFLLPDEPQLLIDRAIVLMELGQEDEALSLLLEVDPKSEEYVQALLTLADYYQMQGLFEAAAKRMDEALTILPNEPLLQFAKAELLFETGRFLEAARIYEDLHAHNVQVDDVSLIERLAEVYRAGAAYETALQYYKQALEQELKPDVLFGAAYASFQAGEYPYAITTLEQLKTLDPDYFSAYLLLAQSYEMEEQLEQAYKAIQEGLTRDEYDKALYLYAGKLALKMGKAQEAIQYLQEAIALDPEYMEAIIVLMSLYRKEENYEAIIQLYQALENEQFDWSALYPFMAKATEALELYDEAAKWYDLAYQDFAEDIAFLAEYVYFLIEEGHRDQALIIARKLAQEEPAIENWQHLVESLQQ